MNDYKLLGPRWIVYFPTDECNFKCKHCYLENIPENHEMNYDEVMKVFSQSKLLKHARIGIAGGEPFLKHDIVEILTGISNLGYKLEITTNGAFPEKIKTFLMNVDTKNVDIAVSIDGLKNTHDKIRDKGSFDKAIQTLKIIQKIGVNLLQVNTVVQKYNIYELRKIKDYFSSLGIKYHFFIPLLSTKNKRVAYTDVEIEKMLPFMHYRFDIKYLLTRGSFRITDCHAGQSTCFMDPTGKVFACMTGQRYFFPRKNYFMGDVKRLNYNFDAVWTSAQADEARMAVKGCEGCYSSCEIHREKSFYSLDDSVNWEEIKKQWKTS